MTKKKEKKKVIAHRRSCENRKGTGLSHYVMMQSDKKK
ncbi:MAG: modified peptide precursor CbpA [Candidatus Scalindua sp.]